MNLTVNWKIILDRFDARLSKWKANLLSIGGRLTLIKSVLGSLGIYYLSIFKTPETVLNLLEKKCASFFWGGTHDSRKLAWVKWPIILASRVNGGLVIGSLKAFNLALLQKWHWRMISNTNALWVKVIKAFHGQEGSFDLNDITSNGIWAKIVGSSNYLHSNAILPSDSIRFHVGCGTSIRFWKELWTGSSPLYLRYNRLFRLEQDKDCLISDRFKDKQWTWNWSRSFMGACNSAYITHIINEVSLTELSSEQDVCYWTIADDGMFSVSSTRHHIDSLILPTLDNPTQWDKTLPRKVNIFMWRFMLDRLPHRLNLSSRGIDIPTIACPSCNGNVESSNHIFFGCSNAKDIWNIIRNWCDIEFPACTSFEH
ncbi:RNA-directed DNA polymerase, eukaryota, reverse transcriptase zinc-binding domain protein [Tanacetum coccineum]